MSLQLAADALAAADPDRLAALMLLPPEARGRMIALHALAAELARAARSASEPMLAEIRLQWWIDALARLPGSAGQHPVLAALAETGWADRAEALAAMGEGHRPTCDDAPFACDEAEGWLDATAGMLAWLGAEALGARPEAEGAVRAQGRALGVARLLARGAPRPLPADVTRALQLAGASAARQAAAGRGLVPRAAASVLYGGPAASHALRGAPPPAEFKRRAALVRFLVTRDWRISVGR